MNQKGSVPILIVILIALVAAGGYLIYTNYSNNRGNQTKPSPTPMVTSQPPQPTPSQAPADETANWKTYTNSVYSFAFKYPPQLSPEQTFEPEKSSSVVISGNLNKSKPDLRLAIVIGYTWGVSEFATGYDAFKSCPSDDECYRIYLEDINRFPRTNLKEVSSTILSKKVRGFEFTDKNQLIRDFPMSRNGKFFLITFGFVNYSQAEINSTQSLLDQILSTFKFQK